MKTYWITLEEDGQRYEYVVSAERLSEAVARAMLVFPRMEVVKAERK